MAPAGPPVKRASPPPVFADAPRASREPPASRQPEPAAGPARHARSRASAAMCAGDSPQQPPTTRAPFSATQVSA